MANERASKRRRLTSDIIIIKVGTDAIEVESFNAHRDVLTDHSPFFKAAVDKKWKEGQTLHMDLPEDDPETVAAYLSWLYDGKLELPTSQDQQDDFTYCLLSKLYVFGEKIQDNKFCNNVIDTLCDCANTPAEDGKYDFPSERAIHIVYEGTPDNSLARQLYVHMYTENLTASWFENAKYHPQFMRDLMIAIAKKQATRYVAMPADKTQWYKKV